MSTTRPFSIRPADPEQKSRWKKCADERGMSLNKWLVLAADSQAELDEAMTREREEAIAERERVQKVAFPQGAPKCRHVAAGQWCYQCNRKKW